MESFYIRPGAEPEKGRRLDWLWLALSAAAAALALALVLLYVPANTAAYVPAAPELSRRFAQEVHNRLGDELRDFTYVRKHYRIATGDLPSKPVEGRYRSTTDPAEVEAAIAAASELMGEETVVAWSPETELVPDSEIQYYYDETILALVWKEQTKGRICTWCEVKVADPSQFRRKLAGDTYGWPIQTTASELAAEDNAVAAVSGDFYAFRTCGIHVYQGELRNVSGDTADTLFVTTDGDMLMVPQWTINSWQEAWGYLASHDIAFSLAFGPILVRDGVNVTPAFYTWGEIDAEYARAVISQVGKLHYVFVAANCTKWDGPPRFTAREAGDLMIEHGCDMAYALDGGQTAEVIFNGRVANRPEFGHERQVSDVLCFASALPEGGKP